MSVTILTKDEEDIIEITLSTVPFSGTTKKAYWGWIGTSDMLVEAQIVVLQGSGEFAPGGTITADFRPGNTAPMHLYFVEQQTEPIKTTWYGSGLDQGAIGPGQVFAVIGIVGNWRVYRSSSKTQFSTTTQFRP
ncbi:MAG: hypothetical protein ABIN80_02880 [Dyadobacter sp.]|uniref:hypothetical protein n=1 Tax=Dyadobacter sp. TaxID=1914288 RepID=UPI0032669592